MDLTASETSAASEATGLISGELGLIYSMALQQGLTPPLSAPEAFPPDRHPVGVQHRYPQQLAARLDRWRP